MHGHESFGEREPAWESFEYAFIIHVDDAAACVACAIVVVGNNWNTASETIGS